MYSLHICFSKSMQVKFYIYITIIIINNNCTIITMILTIIVNIF